MFQLRDYQQDLISRTAAALRRNRAVIIQSPTGSGKTALAVRMLAGARAKGNRCLFLVHRKELMAQTSAALWDQHIEHGLIAAGRSMSRLPIQVGTIQSVANRLDRIPPPDIIVPDECHRSVSPTFRKVIDAFPRAKVVGLTATPERTDGHGLGHLYDEIIEGPSMRWLIDHGYLCDYRLLGPKTSVDTSGLHSRAGDYVASEVQAAVDKPRIIGDAVTMYRTHAMGRRCMAFCAGIKHSLHVCEQYRAAGIQAEHIDGMSTDRERSGALGRFRRGETLVLCSVQLAIEGLDIPAVEVVQQLRPTQSLIVYMQSIGRGLRPSPGKRELMILDHVDNWRRHGLPDDDREWSLEWREQKRAADDEDIQVRQCPQCYHIYRLAAKCPYCNAQAPTKPRAGPEQVDGELAEIDKERERMERRREQARARTIEELVELGVRRGLKSPAAWAAHTYMARRGRKPGPAHFEQAARALRNLKESA